jgi:arylsulfatase A-like enzyme
MKPVFAALVIFVVVTGQAVAADKPNVIFIMADDLGYGDLGCYGQHHILTPNIDQLAVEGTRFTDVYAGSTVCAPSRSVLMTGQHTGHTTVRGNFGKGGVPGLGGGKGRVPLRDEDVTVAELLRSAGYTTGMTGKWGLGEPNTTGTPNKQGFDEWFGYLNQRRAHTYYPDFIWLNDAKYLLPGNTEGKREQYTHDLFTAFALEFIEKHAGGNRPFFLYLPYTVPHAKYEIPSTDPYSDEEWKPDEKVHAAMITRMDLHIGRIVALLKNKKIADDTIVFFCSDNGAANRWEGRFDSSGMLRGRKRDMYEGGIRTPMIVRWPGKVPAGRTNDVPWYFADVLPTLADLVDVPSPANIDGVSVLPTILGKDQPELLARPLYWEFFEKGFQQAARRGKWKAIRKKRGEPIELYDLSTDIREQQNIAAEHPHVVRQFDLFLSEARSESENWPLKQPTQ